MPTDHQRAVAEATSYLRLAEPELTEARARDLAWGAISAAWPYLAAPSSPVREGLVAPSAQQIEQNKSVPAEEGS